MSLSKKSGMFELDNGPYKTNSLLHKQFLFFLIISLEYNISSIKYIIIDEVSPAKEDKGKLTSNIFPPKR